MSEKHFSINIFDLIDSICADFRKHWKAGKRPRIEDYLLKVPENAREQLFRNLLPIDIRYRERSGETAQAAEYVGQFPQYKRVIGDRFNFSTSIEMPAMQSTPADEIADIPAPIEPPSANRIGNYELVRELGRGGFGVVYEAKHVTRGNRVALKTLPTGQDGQEVNADRLHKFRREFRSLSEINHPNLVGMQTLEVDGGQWFLTMDLIDGEDFLSYVRPGGKLDETRLRESLVQLAGGILALHERRILHRDLKPSNVLVDSDGRVSILDFGLVTELEQCTDVTASMQTRNFAGTPKYAAPEQAFGQRSEASDWYAFGTMLYEALVGIAPFTGSPAEVLIKKQKEKVAKLSGREGIPADLAELVDGLLGQEPTGRYTSAQIADRLQLAPETRTRDSLEFSRPAENEFARLEIENKDTFLVGREEQLAQLEAAKQELLEGRKPVFVFLTGLSGEGKSTLAERFLRPIRLGTEMVVLSGRCYDRESMPFKVIDSQIDALVAFLRSRSESEVEEWLPIDIELLAKLFPLLRRVKPIDRRTNVVKATLDERQIRTRAFGAFRNLLRAISQSTPVAIFVDDLQWGDADSAEVLARVLTLPDPPTILLLGSFRSDEMEDSPFFGGWKKSLEATQFAPQVREVKVDPLTEEQCLQLVHVRMGGECTQAMREQALQLFGDTKGNPYFLEQFLEGHDTNAGAFQPVPLSHIIDTRLGRCPFGAEELLDVISVSGKAVSTAEVAAVCRLPESAISTLTHMRSERLVRLSQDDETVDTYHDKIRESLLQRMPTGQQRIIHNEIGQLIERLEGLSVDAVLDEIAKRDRSTGVDTARLYDLAYHFEAGGDEIRAAIYGLSAAEAAMQSFAIEIATEHYARAAKHDQSLASPIRFRLYSGFGRALGLAGDYAAAELAFEKAKELAPDRNSRLRVEIAHAEIKFITSSMLDSISAYDELLQELGIRISRNRIMVIVGILRQTAIIYGCEFINKLFGPKRKRTLSEEQDIGLVALVMQGRPGYFSEPLRTWLAYLVGLRMTLPAPPSRNKGFFHAGLATLNGVILGSRQMSNKHHSAAIAISEKLDDLSLKYSVDLYRGWTLRCLGDYGQGLRSLNAARAGFERIGDSYRVTMTQTELAKIHARLGNIDLAIDHAARSLDVAIKLGQNRLAQSAIEAWSMASNGNLPFEELRVFEIVPDDFTTTIQMLVAESDWHAFHGRITDAARCSDQAVCIMRRNWIFTGLVSIALSANARSLRLSANQLVKPEPAKYRKVRNQCRRYARWARRVSQLFRGDASRALLELSQAEVLFGRHAQAKKLAHKSRDIAQNQGERLELAQSELLLAQIDQELNVKSACSRIETAMAQLNKLADEVGKANDRACVLLARNDRLSALNNWRKKND